MKDLDKDNSDALLVRRVQAGEVEVFDEIDRRYRGLLYRFLTRHAKGPEHAEELCQKTLIRAFEMIGQLQSGASLAGWLHRIAFRYAAADGRQRTMVSLSTLEHVEPTVSMPDRLSGEEERKNLWNVAQSQLSDEEFHILELRYRSNLPLSEIADRIGKKEGAVRVQLHRARKKLLPFFKEYYDADTD